MNFFIKKRLLKKVALRQEKEVCNLIYKLTLQEMECSYEREFYRLKNTNINQCINDIFQADKKQHDDLLVNKIWNLRFPSVRRFKPSDITKKFHYYILGGPGERYKWNPFLYFLERKLDFYSDHHIQSIKDLNKRKPYLKYKGIKYEKYMIAYSAYFYYKFARKILRTDKIEYRNILSSDERLAIFDTGSLTRYEEYLDDCRFLSLYKSVARTMSEDKEVDSQSLEAASSLVEHYKSKVKESSKWANTVFGNEFIHADRLILDYCPSGCERYTGFHRTYLCYAELLKKFSNWLECARLIKKYYGSSHSYSSKIYEYVIFHLRLGMLYYQGKMEYFGRFLYDLYTCMRTKIKWFSYSSEDVSSNAIDDAMNFNYWLWEQGIERVNNGQLTIGEFYTWYTSKLLVPRKQSKDNLESLLKLKYKHLGNDENDDSGNDFIDYAYYKIDLIGTFLKIIGNHKKLFTKNIGDVRTMSLPKLLPKPPKLLPKLPKLNLLIVNKKL